MPSGRCSGCGRTGSLRTVNQHVVDCSDYLTLFLTEPSRCLTPAAEHQRHRVEDTTPEVRARHRGDRLTRRFTELTRQQNASARRWSTPPDILT